MNVRSVDTLESDVKITNWSTTLICYKNELFLSTVFLDCSRAFLINQCIRFKNGIFNMERYVKGNIFLELAPFSQPIIIIYMIKCIA